MKDNHTTRTRLTEAIERLDSQIIEFDNYHASKINREIQSSTRDNYTKVLKLYPAGTIAVLRVKRNSNQQPIGKTYESN